MKRKESAPCNSDERKKYNCKHNVMNGESGSREAPALFLRLCLSFNPPFAGRFVYSGR